MTSQFRNAGLVTLALGLWGCAHVDMNEMIISPADVVATDKLQPNDHDHPNAIEVCNTVDTNKPLVDGAKPAVQTQLDNARTPEEVRAALDSAASAPVDNYVAPIPSELADTAVMRTILNNTKIALVQPIRQTYQQRYSAQLTSTGSKSAAIAMVKANDQTMAAYIDSLRSPPLSNQDFRIFRDEFSEKMLRHTNKASATQAASGTSTANDSTFWDDLKAYYDAYVHGNFVDHFGIKYDKPSLSLTISDAELAYTVGVFIELVFDAAAKTPVWQPVDKTGAGTISKGSTTVTALSGNIKLWQAGMAIGGTGTTKKADDKTTEIPDVTTIASIDPTNNTLVMSKPAGDSGPVQLTVTSLTYFPGGTANKPTALTAIKGIQLNPISLDPNDIRCGMTQLKFDAVDDLAQAFSSASSNAIGSAVGTIGGVGISFGFFGKASIGDNKAGTALIQAVVAQLVKRMSFEMTYPVISAVGYTSKDVDTSSQSPSSVKSQLTQFFSSSNAKTPEHYWWLPW